MYHFSFKSQSTYLYTHENGKQSKRGTEAAERFHPVGAEDRAHHSAHVLVLKPGSIFLLSATKVLVIDFQWPGMKQSLPVNYSFIILSETSSSKIALHLQTPLQQTGACEETRKYNNGMMDTLMKAADKGSFRTECILRFSKSKNHVLFSSYGPLDN